MHAATTLPEITSVEQAHGVLTSLYHQLQQALRRVAQLEKQLYGASSERRPDERRSKEQVLLSLFAPAEPAAVQQVLIALKESSSEPRVRRALLERYQHLLH